MIKKWWRLGHYQSHPWLKYLLNVLNPGERPEIYSCSCNFFQLDERYSQGSLFPAAHWFLYWLKLSQDCVWFPPSANLCLDWSFPILTKALAQMFFFLNTQMFFSEALYLSLTHTFIWTFSDGFRSWATVTVFGLARCWDLNTWALCLFHGTPFYLFIFLNNW